MPVPLDRIKAAVLADNRALEPLRSEHGWSMWIQAAGKNILFDTGQGTVLAENAKTLGVDLGSIDIIVVSHGHYDHTGGLPLVLPCAQAAEIYLHAGVFLERYSLQPDGAGKPIQMPGPAGLALRKHSPNKVHVVGSPWEIHPGVFITGPIPRKNDFEDVGGKFYLDQDCKRLDTIEDDQSLWLETDQGLLIITGCCHSGLVNTIAHIQAHSSQKPIYAIIGGFHLLNADARRMKMTIQYLQSLKIGRLYPCHCTGEKAVVKLKKALGNIVKECRAGILNFGA